MYMNKNKLLLLILILIILFVGIFILVNSNKAPNNKIIQPETKTEIIQKSNSEKLTGDSLLIQINKQHCLPVDYSPKDLVNISDYGIPADSNFQLREIAITDLKSMIAQAQKDGISLKVISAYRSYQDQQRIFNSWVKQLGIQEATKESAPAGCSQHELGTAVDFNELDFSFANTPAGLWLAKNAWQYGWVISYLLNSESSTGYVYEPWHYRYIGVANALEMQKSGLILSKFLDTKNNF